MKFSCTQENLSQGLQMVSHIASKNISLPILNNVLLKIENKELKLITTNLEMAIGCRLRAKIEEDGEFTVPSRLFADYLAMSPPGRVDVELKGTEFFIQTGADKTSIKGNEAGEFPLIPQLERNHVYGFKVEDFKKMLQQVLFAASRNEARPELGGVNLNFNGYKKGFLIAAATDSYRLAEKEVKILEGEKYSQETAGAIVPARALQECLRVISTFHEELEGEMPVELVVAEGQVMFSYGSVEITSRLVAGAYPDYRQIIPASFKTTINFSVSEWLRRIRAASLFTNMGINGINLEFKAGHEQKAIISAMNSQFGAHTGEVLCQIEGEDNQILLNYRYLLDGLAGLGAEEAILKLNSADSPCLLISKDGGGYLYIIMPIKQ